MSVGELTMVDMIAVLLRHRRLIIGVTLAAMLLAGIHAYMLPDRYRSRASILPSGQTDRLADLKSLAGLASGAPSAENSSELYPTILRSHTVLNEVLAAQLEYDDDGRSVRTGLPEYFAESNPDLLRDALAGITTIGVSKRTGEIEIVVETTSPGLSRAVLAEYIRQLENYNLYERKSQARENVEYLAGQLELTLAELAAAEDSLSRFQNLNRNWPMTSDPDLLKQLARYRRDVEVKTRTYAFLVQEYEVASIEARKDVPIVRLLDSPSLPTMKSGPARKVRVILAGFGALALMLLVVVIREAFRRQSDSAGEIVRDLNRAFPRSNRAIRLVKRQLIRENAHIDS